MFQRRTLIAALCASCVAPCALADAWPSRPLRIVSPYSAGGGSDYLARFLAIKLGVALGQPVVVENRPGAGGMMGTDMVAKAAPDGYTILIGANGPLSVLPALGTRLPYVPLQDFQPVSLLSKQPFVLLTNAVTPVTGLREFIELAKKNPGKLNYGTAGTGSAPQLAVEMLKMKTSSFITHVPYRGGPPALNDLMANQIQLATSDPNTAMPQIRQGRLRALAVTSGKRSPLLPDVPTVAEAAVPGYDVSGWFGALVPVGTPAPIVERLHAEIAKAMATPEAREVLSGLGGELLASTPAEFASTIEFETKRWRQVIEAMNIKPEN